MIGYNEKAERESLARLMHDMEHIRDLFDYTEERIFAEYTQRYGTEPTRKKEKDAAILWWYLNLSAWVLEKQRSGKYALNFYNSNRAERRLYSVLADQEWHGSNEKVHYVLRDLVEEEEKPVLTQEEQDGILADEALREAANISELSKEEKKCVAKVLKDGVKGNLIRSRVLRNLEEVAKAVRQYQGGEERDEAVARMKKCIGEIPALEKRISTREFDILLDGLEDGEKTHIKRCIAMQCQIPPTLEVIFALMKLAENAGRGESDGEMLSELNKSLREIKKSREKAEKEPPQITFDVVDNQYSPIERSAEARELGICEEPKFAFPMGWEGWTPGAVMLPLMMYRLLRQNPEEKDGLYMIPGGQGALGVYEGITKTSSNLFEAGKASLERVKDMPVVFRNCEGRTLIGLKKSTFEKFKKVEKAAAKETLLPIGGESGESLRAETLIEAMREPAQIKADVIERWNQPAAAGSERQTIDGGFMLYDDGGNNVYRSLMPRQAERRAQSPGVIINRQAETVRDFLTAEAFDEAQGDQAVNALSGLFVQLFGGSSNFQMVDRALLADMTTVKDGVWAGMAVRYAMAFLYKGETVTEGQVAFADAQQGPAGFAERFKEKIAADHGKALYNFARDEQKNYHALIKLRNDNTHQLKKFSVCVLDYYKQNTTVNLKEWMTAVATAQAGSPLPVLSGEEKKQFVELVDCGLRRYWMSRISVNKQGANSFESTMGTFAQSAEEIDRESGNKNYSEYKLERTEDRAFQLVCTYIASFAEINDTGYQIEQIPAQEADLEQRRDALLGMTSAPGWGQHAMNMYYSNTVNARGYMVKVKTPTAQ